MIDQPTEDAALIIASTGQRFLNLFLDAIFIVIFGYILGSILGGLFSLIGERDAFANAIEAGGWVSEIVLALLYFVPQEALTGRTAAKWITGTRAVASTGGELSIGQALVRTLCRFIPLDPLSFLFGKGAPVGWHDSIPKTVVITTRINRATSVGR